jgi:hypothetical protein
MLDHFIARKGVGEPVKEKPKRLDGDDAANAAEELTKWGEEGDVAPEDSDDEDNP